MTVATALPPAFEATTRTLFGEERYECYVAALHRPAPVAIRLNPFKPIAPPAGAESVAWCRDGYWLPTRPSFTLDPLFHAGCYYVEEAASMFLDTVLRQYVREPVVMLDLCAAPGGKSTLARAALPAGSLLYANDCDHRRAQVLVENMQKQGHPDVIITNAYARDYLAAGLSFDVILADVPCSAEGLFREGDAQRLWSEQRVERCAAQQRTILRDIWPCLRTNGILIYATCTYNTRENEENIAWLMAHYGAVPLRVDTDAAWGITGALPDGSTMPAYRFIPGLTRSNGLFLAVVRKTDTTAPPRHGTTAPRLLYDARRTTTTPTAATALRCDLPATAYPRVPLSYAAALRYLRREALVLPADTPQGLVVVCYDGHPLGFANNIGTRANNLYPTAWRIKNQ